MKTTPGKRTVTKQEQAGSLTEKSLAAVSKKIKETFQRMRAGISDIEKKLVGFGNDALQLGFYFQEASGGKEQLEFYLFQRIPELPDELSFQLAQHCVAMVNRLGPKHRFKSAAEAMPELKLLFQDMNLLEPSSRTTHGGTPIETNWGAWIVTTFTPINRKLQDMLRSDPVEKWDMQRCENFLAQTEFISQKRVEVRQKLEQGGVAG